MWYMYWGYVDGSGAYDYISRWHSMGNNRYITFFDDTCSNPYVDVYVNFNRISGNNYKTGYAFALVDSRDIS